MSTNSNVASNWLTSGELYPGAPAYADAAAVRADLDLLSDSELEAIYAATDGARTAGALTRYDASGQLVPSAVTETATGVQSLLPIELSATVAQSNTIGLCRPINNTLQFNTTTGGNFQWRFGAGGIGARMSITGLSLGMGASAAARRLEVRDATAAQQRWSYSDTVYGERQVDANGVMLDTTTGNIWRWWAANNVDVTLTRLGNQWNLYANSTNGFTVGVSTGGNLRGTLTTAALRINATNILEVDASLVTASRPLFLSNQADPETPTGGGVIWVDSSGNLKFKSSGGTVTTLGVV